MLFKKILGERGSYLLIILGDYPYLWEVLTPFAAFLRGPPTQKKGKLENRGLSCQSQSFLEIHSDCRGEKETENLREFVESPRRFGMKCITSYWLNKSKESL
jgi:hypothetical protein